MDIYVLAGNVTNLTAGVYRYQPQNHELVQLYSGDVREEFVNSAVVPRELVDWECSRHLYDNRQL
ncbi:MAG: hypothetical protein LUO89_00505 [Methanothrix sp.]|nr:hypothetical protein [Methanothrix sp.]